MDVATREMRHSMTATYRWGSRDAEHVRRTGEEGAVCVCNWHLIARRWLCDLLGSAVSEAVDDWGSAGRGALVGHATERIGALWLVAV